MLIFIIPKDTTRAPGMRLERVLIKVASDPKARKIVKTVPIAASIAMALLVLPMKGDEIPHAETF